mmetsp:Transcript_15734/g.36225  ORF Transcript_15734/g.36225 Transcript_15734/m.36225 type:complete len:122 (+) Transcript_15734:854-1219(+)
MELHQHRNQSWREIFKCIVFLCLNGYAVVNEHGDDDRGVTDLWTARHQRRYFSSASTGAGCGWYRYVCEMRNLRTVPNYLQSICQLRVFSSAMEIEGILVWPMEPIAAPRTRIVVEHPSQR